MSIPTATDETTKDKMYASPLPPPGPWSVYLTSQLDRKIYEAYTCYRVPYLVIKNLIDEDWTDLASLTQRFADAKTVHEKGGKALDLDKLGYTEKQQEKILARVAAAHEDLRKYQATRVAELQKPRHKLSSSDTDRKTMEEQFKVQAKIPCPLKHQGSKHLLGKLVKGASEGRIEDIANKEIVPFLPDPATKTDTKRATTDEGSIEVYQVESQQDPKHTDEWVAQMRCWYHTLFMVLCVHRQFSQLHVEWELLSDFYEKFLFGPTLLKRNRPPSLRIIMIMERRAWQQIITWMYDGMSLTAAIQKIQGDSLWWTNELEAGRQAAPAPPTRRPTQDRPTRQYFGQSTRVWQHTRKPTAPGKGAKGASKGSKGGAKGRKGKGGGGKGGKQQRNDLQDRQNHLPQGLQNFDWYQTGPNNIQFCRPFHTKGTCRNQPCTRDHTCPLCKRGSHSALVCQG